jgi:polyribonucleotide nucleotidyltransferase
MQQKTQFEQTVERAGKKVVENNPDYDENSMLDLVNKGKEKGIMFDSTNATEESVLSYLNLLNMAEGKVKAASQTEKQPSDTAEKVKEASKVKSNLSDIGSTETDGRDYNDMSPMEWAKLPDNKRAELLGI